MSAPPQGLGRTQGHSCRLGLLFSVSFCQDNSRDVGNYFLLVSSVWTLGWVTLPCYLCKPAICCIRLCGWETLCFAHIGGWLTPWELTFPRLTMMQDSVRERKAWGLSGAPVLKWVCSSSQMQVPRGMYLFGLCVTLFCSHTSQAWFEYKYTHYSRDWDNSTRDTQKISIIYHLCILYLSVYHICHLSSITYLSINLSSIHSSIIYVSIDLSSIYPCLRLSVHPSIIYLPIQWSVYLSIYHPSIIYLCTYPLIYLYIYATIHSSIHQSIIYVSTYPLIYLSIHPSTYLSTIYLFIPSMEMYFSM